MAKVQVILIVGNGSQEVFEAIVARGMRLERFSLNSITLEKLCSSPEEKVKNLLGKSSGGVQIEVLSLAGHQPNIQVVKVVDSTDVICYVDETYVLASRPVNIFPGDIYLLQLGDLFMEMHVKND